MSLSIRLDNDGLRLADALVDRLRAPLADPLAEEVIVVPSLGVGRWLQQRIADRSGVCANVRLDFPGRLLWRILGQVLPDLAPRSPFDASRAQWVVLALFDRLPGDDPAFAVLRRRVERAGDADRLALAREIAATFDRYLAYRRAWLAGWDRDGPAGAPADAQIHPQPHRPAARPVAAGPGRIGQLGPDEDWQRWMWRHLVEALGVGARHPFDRFLAAVDDAQHQGPQALAALRARVGLERVSLWGALPMAPEQLQLYGRLSTLIDVHLFVPDPCREFWQDVTDERLRARFAQERPEDPWLIDDGPRLLGEWGKSQRDTLIGVAELEERAGVQADDDFRTRPVAPPANALQALQHALLARDDAVWEQLPDVLDAAALQVHSCHGLMRQVEVLHDRLLDCFLAIDDLQPGEVVVFCTDVDAAAPCVQAVFGGAPAARRVPFSVTGRALDEQPGVAAVLSLLELARGRVSLPALVQLLENPAIGEALQFAPDDPQQLTERLVAAGVHWGFDGLIDEPASSAAGRDERHGWRSGLDRLLLGAVMSEGVGRFDDLLAVQGAAGQQGELFGRLMVLLRALAAYARAARRPATVAEWSRRLSALIGELFADVRVHLDELRTVRQALASVVEAGRVVPNLEVAAQVFEAALRAELASAPPAALPSGAVTFCPVGSLRGVPYRVVVLLGADEGAFPRRHRLPEYDLMRRNPWRGDRIAGIEDRGVFLDLVMAARDRLLLLYSGRNARDNSVTNPSLLVSDLVAYVRDRVAAARGDAGCDGDGGAALLDAQHPLQPFGPVAFGGGDAAPAAPGRGGPGDLRSFADQWLEAARRIDAPIGSRLAPTALVAGLDSLGAAEVHAADASAVPGAAKAGEPVQVPASGTVTVDQVVDLLSNPARAWLRHGLEIGIVREQALPEESEPLDAGLVAGDPQMLEPVLDDLIQGRTAGEAQARLEIAPSLPAGTAGAVAARALVERAGQVLSEAGMLGVATRRRTLEAIVSLPGGATVRLSGTVLLTAADTDSGLHSDQDSDQDSDDDSGSGGGAEVRPGVPRQVVVSSYPVNARAVIEAWLKHLLWLAADPEPAEVQRSTLLAGAGAALRIDTSEPPGALLSWAVGLALQLRHQPRLLLPKVIWSLYGRGPVPESFDALDATARGRARSALQGGRRADGAARGALDDPWVAALLRDADPPLEAVIAAGLPVYRRIFDNCTTVVGSIDAPDDDDAH